MKTTIKRNVHYSLFTYDKDDLYFLEENKYLTLVEADKSLEKMTALFDRLTEEAEIIEQATIHDYYDACNILSDEEWTVLSLYG